ncbi:MULTISPECIES: RNA-binding protein [Thalassotalea]|uniref:RNA-binding protein n=1 Tax=Thalassotalea castellviae TaxID=3075612 RepID=A0ABU3A406_9GAMM|nr:RNA-binding protein [Thalassotalea sp. W431]MDT0604912.1 RNA-binding protein [Thalassotalea sp. W431]
MNSPKLLNVIIALIFAIVAYFIADNLLNTSLSIAIFVFITAIITSLFGSQSSLAEEDDGEVSTLYVGNLPYRANEGAVRALFSEYGNVHSVRLMKDKHTGKRRGFGFVEMSACDADNAVSQLNDSEFQQRTLKVREAKERPEKSDNNE